MVSSLWVHRLVIAFFLSAILLDPCCCFTTAKFGFTKTIDCHSNSFHNIQHARRSIVSWSSYENASIEKKGQGKKFVSPRKKINGFGLVFGAVALLFGIFGWMAMLICEGVYRIFGAENVDPNRVFPVLIGIYWGKILLYLTGSMPIVYGKENLKHRQGNKPFLFVANHCSWMDIPYVVVAILAGGGSRNYKMIAKKDLENVPILSTALRSGGHVLLDKTNPRSQLKAYMQCVKWLKKGVNVIIFPEGKLSQTGRLEPSQNFKAGAFQMAKAVGAPIVPVAICHSHQIHPPNYLFPLQPSRRIPVTVHIGTPIPSTDPTKSAMDLATEAWNAIAELLPESQKPLTKTPFLTDKGVDK